MPYIVRTFLTVSMFCARQYLLGNKFKFASEIIVPAATGIRRNAQTLIHNGNDAMMSSSSGSIISDWFAQFIVADNNNSDPEPQHK